MAKNVAVITGIDGQDGAYLARFLVAKGYSVVGLARSTTKKSLERLLYLDVLSDVILVKGSIDDQKKIAKILRTYQPREWYNFAGQSSVTQSWEAPAETLTTNFNATMAILENIRLLSPATRFFNPSSAQMYGNSEKSITERSYRFEPPNPYALSKAAAHWGVHIAREHYGTYAVNGILFNHESPLRQANFVTKKICQGVVAIAMGEAARIEVGDLSVRRDWGFAGDYVEAMWLMLQQQKPTDAVICTGITRSLADFAAEAFRVAGVKVWKNRIIQKKEFIRKDEIKEMKGSNQAIKKMGWMPRTSFKELVEMMITYEFEQLKKSR